MACKDCEKAEGKGIAYYRWKSANVGMIGCDKHIREIFDALSAVQAQALQARKEKA